MNSQVCCWVFGVGVFVCFVLLILPSPCTKIIYLTNKTKEAWLQEGIRSLLAKMPTVRLNPLGTFAIFPAGPWGTKFSWEKTKTKQTQKPRAKAKQRSRKSICLTKQSTALSGQTLLLNRWRKQQENTEGKPRGHIMALEHSRNN